MTHVATLALHGPSRSFPADEHPFPGGAEADVLVLAGERAGEALAETDAGAWAAVLVELGTECLGVHTGESRGEEGSNVLGFARWRLGDDPPSRLVELVRQPRSLPGAVEAARAALESAGLEVAVCLDFGGRILDRLLRPHFNAALRALDEGLASADDLDLTVRLGLGYPEGPIALLERSGLEHHHDVSRALFEASGDPALAPERRAAVAAERARRRRG